MRQTRMLGIALVTFLALAGGALAVGAGLTAAHSADVAGHSVSGSAAASASEKGADLAGGLHTGVADVDGSVGATLPALPDVPHVDAPSLPSVPDVSGGVAAAGTGSVDAGPLSGNAGGDASVTLG